MEVQRKIWDFCKANGMTDAGAAAVLGNIEAESAFKASNVEDRCPISDAEYTAAVDIGNYNADLFVKDAYGYGLCQWTYPPRKAHLLAAAQNKGVSIADVDMQLEFLFKELNEDYYKVLATLLSSSNVRECTEAFMRQFENPADQSEAAIVYRTGLAMRWYDRYAHTAPDTNTGENMTYKYVSIKLRELCEGLQGEDVRVMQMLLWLEGATALGIDGIFGAETRNALAKYQAANRLAADGICGKNTWSALLGGKTE